MPSFASSAARCKHSGSTTVICTDKTGTLTKNEMTVKVIFDGEHVFDVTGSGYDPEGEILHEWMVPTEEERKNLFMSLRIGLLCNESRLYEEDGEYKVDGDPTEGALIVSALKGGLIPERKKTYTNKWPSSLLNRNEVSWPRCTGMIIKS